MAGKNLFEMAAGDQVKRAIHELIEIYEANFPGRIAGYYVEGSYADHTSVSTSDVDIVIVFRERFADEQMRRAAEQLCKSLEESATVELDLMVIDEDSLRLRAICERVLDFERAFLVQYSDYLLTQFSRANSVNLKHILWVQEQVPLAADSVVKALSTAKLHMQ